MIEKSRFTILQRDKSMCYGLARNGHDLHLALIVLEGKNSYILWKQVITVALIHQLRDISTLYIRIGDWENRDRPKAKPISNQWFWTRTTC